MDEDEVALTDAEREAIASLQRLAKRWPQSLTLLSMESTLHVMRTGDPRFTPEHPDGPDQPALIEAIYGIPNDGGAW